MYSASSTVNPTNPSAFRVPFSIHSFLEPIAHVELLNSQITNNNHFNPIAHSIPPIIIAITKSRVPHFYSQTRPLATKLMISTHLCLN